MIYRFLNLVKGATRPRAKPICNPDLNALAELDRRTLEDIGASPEAVAMCSPLKAVRWNADVIASGYSTRWSLSSDWDRPC